MSKWLNAKNALIALAVALILGGIGGMTTAWVLWVRPSQKTILQTYEPGQKNPDDSYRAEKTPTSNPAPKQQVPTGSKVSATANVVVRPHGQRATATTKAPGTSATALPPLPSSEPPEDVRIDATIYQTKDGQDHLVVSSPDGEIVSANYSPVVKRVRESNLKNALGLYAGITTAPAREFGVFYDRDFAWFRAGAEIGQIKYLNLGKTEYTARVKGGIRF